MGESMVRALDQPRSALLLLAILLLGFDSCLGHGWRVQRMAHLQRGSVETRTITRGTEHRRLLLGGTSLLAPHVFLVGLASPGQGDQLREAVGALDGASVINYIPQDHFIVYAQLDQILELQDQLGVTAALLPPTHKIAFDVDTILSAAHELGLSLARTITRHTSNLGGLVTGAAATTRATPTATAFTSGTTVGLGPIPKRLGYFTTGAWDQVAARVATGAWDQVAARVAAGASLEDVLAEEGQGEEGGQEGGALPSPEQAVEKLQRIVKTSGQLQDGSLSVSLLIMLATEGNIHSLAVQKLVTQWKRALAKLVGVMSKAKNKACSVEATAPGVVHIKACPEHLAAVTTWVSQQPQVVWVEPRLETFQTNIYSSTLIQTGEMPNPKDVDRDGLKLPEYHPFWVVGLNGSGQVVSVVDTGAAMGSCYLNDASIDVLAVTKETSKGSTTGRQVFTSSQHRKVANYFAYRSMYDEVGHGTHVAGTILGYPEGISKGQSVENWIDAAGIAPGARLAVFDAFSKDMKQGTMDVPSGQGTFLWDINYKAGARIQCNSWGEETYAYSQIASSSDRYMWEHPEFLNLQAAGNDGDMLVEKEGGAPGEYSGTIKAPGTGKNTLTVGSVDSWSRPSHARSLVRIDVRVFSSRITSEEVETRQPFASIHRLAASEWPINGSVKSLSGVMEMYMATPELACSQLTNEKEVIRSGAAFFRRGSCTFAQKANMLVQAGAKFGVMVNVDSESLAGQDMVIANQERMTVPIITLPLDDGNPIVELMRFGFYAYISINTFADLEDVPPEENVPSYSSFGPTEDGRMKPEIVAPGATVSAWTNWGGSELGAYRNDNCANKLFLEGTSMSTPGIAGAAAIIRQYFMHGFLNNGTCGMTDGMEPSGMLLRGVLVAGAVSLNGYSMATAYPILPAPSSHQGFGRVDLSRSLPLAGDAKGWKLQVHDMVPIDSQMEFTYEVECTGGGPLIVVLSWYDYWSFGGAGGKLLINDLDVAVIGRRSRIKSIWLGNGITEATPYAQRETLTRDSTNNIEKVILENPARAVYTVTVRSHFINGKSDMHPTQFFSLVLLGGLGRSGIIEPTSTVTVTPEAVPVL